MINAINISKKNIKKIKLVLNGAGASAMACTNLFINRGVSKKNIIMLDRKGVDTLKGDIEDHPGYPIGEVKLKRFSFFLNENERSNLEIICFDALKLEDRLSVSLKSLEFNNWMFKLHK